MKKFLFAMLVLALSPAAFAQTTVPYTFSAGQTAKASEVNGDMQALTTAIDNLAARVSKLEGQFTAADLNGAVYAMHRIGVAFGNSPITNHDSYTGTVTLSANGTFVMAQTDTYYNNAVAAGSPTVNKSVTNDTYNGSWALSGKTLSITVTGASTITIDCLAGGRLCAGNINNDSGGNVQLFMLLRTN